MGSREFMHCVTRKDPRESAKRINEHQQANHGLSDVPNMIRRIWDSLLCLDRSRTEEFRRSRGQQLHWLRSSGNTPSKAQMLVACASNFPKIIYPGDAASTSTLQVAASNSPSHNMMQLQYALLYVYALCCAEFMIRNMGAMIRISLAKDLRTVPIVISYHFTQFPYVE